MRGRYRWKRRNHPSQGQPGARSDGCSCAELLHSSESALCKPAVAALEPDTQNSYFANRLVDDLNHTARVMATPALVFEEIDRPKDYQAQVHNLVIH